MDKNDKFMTYEYTSVSVKKNMEAVYVDTYESFGWELINNEVNFNPKELLSTKLSFKRDRKINNKIALNKLQKNTDMHFLNIEKLEDNKYFSASLKAYTIGIMACVFLALSVFMITGMLSFGSFTSPLQIILGGIGILLTIPPYFVYHNTVTLKTEQLEPLIEKEYDIISDICEEGNLLIKN